MTNPRTTNPFISFLIGGVLGTAAALLFAPASGRESRNSISRKVDSILSGANEKKNSMIRRAQKFSDKIISSAENTYKRSAKLAEGRMNASGNPIFSEIIRLRDALSAAIDEYNKKDEPENEIKSEKPENEKYIIWEDETLPKQEGMKRRR